MIDLLSPFCPIFAEVAQIMSDRQQTPGVVRDLAEVARLDENASDSRMAIAMLVERRLLPTTHPTADDLRRIEDMTDEEILVLLRRAFH